jgi:thiol-disulfide isomerase/thioredoxin
LGWLVCNFEDISPSNLTTFIGQEIVAMNSKIKLQNHKVNSSRREKAANQRRQEQIRNILLAAGSVLIIASILFASLSKSVTHNVIPARIGSALGDFSLSDVKGNTVHLSDYKGKTVLINAWATWCPPCKAEMPLLNRYYQSHAQDGFILLAVNAGDSQNEAASFANQKGLAFPVLLDPGTQLLGRLGINSFPTSILIGRDGVVKTIHVGMFTPESIEAELTPLLVQ